MGLWTRQHTFDPRAVGATVQAWYRADLGITLNGSNVSNWNDQSGTGDSNKNAAQATGGSQPAYTAADSSVGGAACLGPLGGSAMMTTGTWTSPVTQPFTEFFSGTQNSNGVDSYFYDNVSGTACGAWKLASGSLYKFTGNASTLTSTGSDWPFAALVNGASSALYERSLTATATGTLGSVSRTSIRMCGSVSNTLLLRGRLCEIVVYSGDVGATIREIVMRYMGVRYGHVVTP